MLQELKAPKNLMVLETKTYAPNTVKEFRFLDGMNRTVIPKHVTAMRNSIIKLNAVIRPVVVADIDFLPTGDGTYILDGQHLYQAILGLGCNIPTTKIKVQDLDHMISCIASLNTTSKSWSLDNYVDMWASASRRRDYKKLQVYRKEYDLGYSTIIRACCPSSMRKSVADMKVGNFKIEDSEFTDLALKRMSEIFNIIPKGFKSEIGVFVEGYIEFFNENPKYRHPTFLNALTVNKVIVGQSLHKVSECKRVLTDIYNGGKTDRTIILMKSGSAKGRPDGDTAVKGGTIEVVAK